MTPKEQEQAICKANLRAALKSAVGELGTADYWAVRIGDQDILSLVRVAYRVLSNHPLVKEDA